MLVPFTHHIVARLTSGLSYMENCMLVVMFPVTGFPTEIISVIQASFLVVTYMEYEVTFKMQPSLI